MKGARERGLCTEQWSSGREGRAHEVGREAGVSSSKRAEVGDSTRKSRPQTVNRVRRRSLLTAWFLNLSTVGMLG